MNKKQYLKLLANYQNNKTKKEKYICSYNYNRLDYKLQVFYASMREFEEAMRLSMKTSQDIDKLNLRKY